MRCLTLANAMRIRGAELCFVCRPHKGHLGEHIVAAGHELCLLPPATQVVTLKPNTEQVPVHALWLGERWETDLTQTQATLRGKQFDWLIVDHYSLDARWESAMRKFARNIMVIDDLADRMHDCDLLLDQTLGRSLDLYKPLVQQDCKLLIGPKYALLRPEFPALRELSLNRRKKPKMKNLMVTFGGIDNDNLTGQALDVLKDSPLPKDCRITIVVGTKLPWLNTLKRVAQGLPWPTRVLINVSQMAHIMMDSDLCIGSAGSTSWERCCLGLPTLMMILSSNQQEIAWALEQKKAVIILSEASDIKDNIDMLCRDPKRLDAMSQASSCVTDGSGLETVVRHLENTYS
jgi:UDP-2,4-diacetamido-2,4,6-trideoxy-beta-L-altropyranose hydrolase